MGLGAGVGDGSWWTGMSTLGAGECCVDPVVVFNPAPFGRDELIRFKIWNRELPDLVTVRDPEGKVAAGQVIERGNYWGHSFAVVAFKANALPALGYRAYVIEPVPPGDDDRRGTGPRPTDRRDACPTGAWVRETGRPLYGLGYVQAQPLNPVVLENEHLELTVSSDAGGIVSLVDKPSGADLALGIIGAVEREQEAPHGMTAWQLGPIVDRALPLANGTLTVTQNGPNLAAVRLDGKHNDSTYALTISLAAGSRQIGFDLDVNWLERGEPATGVPALRVSFPMALSEDGKATFEIANGSIEREADGEEAPALNWVDLAGPGLFHEDGAEIGATLVNNSKYGHQVSGDTIRLTLLRSSHDPDPLPEIGAHHISFTLIPRVGGFDVAEATRQGYAFNHPCVPIGTTLHEGDLAAEQSLVEVITPNVMFASLKQAEDSEALVIRLYEMTGQETVAQVSISDLLCNPNATAVETDIMEQPLAESSANMWDGVLSVTVPAFGIAAVKVG